MHELIQMIEQPPYEYRFQLSEDMIEDIIGHGFQDRTRNSAAFDYAALARRMVPIQFDSDEDELPVETVPAIPQALALPTEGYPGEFSFERYFGDFCGF